MRRTAALVTAGALVALAACTATPPDDERPTPATTASPTVSEAPPAPASAQTRLPDAATTVLDARDAVGRAAAMSQALFATAPVAVVAPADDADAQLRAGAVAVRLGAPLLLADGDDGALARELARLEAEAVLTVGDVTVDDVPAVPAPEDLATLPEPDDDGGPADPVDAVVAVERGEGRTEVDGLDAPGAVEVPAPLSDGVVLTTGGARNVAAVASARAAGLDVVRTEDPDPRRSTLAIEALTGSEHTRTVAIGAGFGAPDVLAGRVATAAGGRTLPGGGQVLFPGRRLVALYGTPGTAALGVLGEQELDASIERVKDLAARYQEHTDDVVVPAFEIIVTIASAEKGDDGNYSNELPVERFVPWIEAADEAGVYVVLDLQPGRTDFLTQAKQYEELLRYPNVGLALDPEWRLRKDQRHLEQIGSVRAKEVNRVVDWLADLTRDEALPQKLLILHQFSLRMIRDREWVDTSRDELAVLIHADGQGGQPAKQGTWTALHQGAPDGVWWGWKNFLDEDSPMLTVEQTYARVKPVPHFVSYQ